MNTRALLQQLGACLQCSCHKILATSILPGSAASGCAWKHPHICFPASFGSRVQLFACFGSILFFGQTFITMFLCAMSLFSRAVRRSVFLYMSACALGWLQNLTLLIFQNIKDTPPPLKSPSWFGWVTTKNVRAIFQISWLSCPFCQGFNSKFSSARSGSAYCCHTVCVYMYVYGLLSPDCWNKIVARAMIQWPARSSGWPDPVAGHQKWFLFLVGKMEPLEAVAPSSVFKIPAASWA